MTKVLVCDDEKERCDQTVETVSNRDGINSEDLSAGDLTNALKQFFRAIKDYFANPETAMPFPGSSFDGYDILILDNNLAGLEIEGARVTAESIAGYIRAFSNTPYNISLNKTPNVDFDLRYLVGDYSTRADLALNARHLENPALWTGDVGGGEDGFCPWYWPTLAGAPPKRRSQIKFLVPRLEKTVLESLDFSDQRSTNLLPHAQGVISPSDGVDGGDDPITSLESVTFFDLFLARDRSLPAIGDREPILRAARKGNDFAREVIARVVASDLEQWFRQDVVGPQETLVDVPHLLMRLPFLLGDQASDIEVWNRAVRNPSAPYGLDGDLYREHLEASKFRCGIWVTDPCFWWNEVKEIEALNEGFLAASEGEWADAVFCEDTSRFILRNQETNSPTEFVAQFEGSWERRYVKHVNGFQYSPRTRLALQF